MLSSAFAYHKFFACVLGILAVVYFALTRFKIDKCIKFYTLQCACESGVVKFPALRNLRPFRARRRLYNGRKFLKRIRLFLPIFYAVLAAVVTTGSVMLPAMHGVSASAWAMSVGTLAIIALSAVAYKRLKQAFFTQNFAKYKSEILKFLTAIFAIILIVSFI